MTNGTWREEMRGCLAGSVDLDAPTSHLASLRVGGRADALAYPRDEADLRRLLRFLDQRGIPYCAVGNWTNCFVASGGYRGVLVSLGAFRDLRLGGPPPQTRIQAGAGTPLAEAVRLAGEAGLTGLEFCAGIPGSVGGAVCMNAGAFGREIRDALAEVTVMDRSGAASRLPAGALAFAYRRLALPAGALILGACFALERGDRGDIADRMAEILARRRERHPLDQPSAGSVFKNPPDAPAGRLIDEAGLKGTRVGDALVSLKHGNFIVNAGRATAAEVEALIDRIKARVWQDKGIALEEEVRIMGERHVHEQ